MHEKDGRRCISNEHIVCIYCTEFQKDAIKTLLDLYASAKSFKEIQCNQCKKTFKVHKTDGLNVRFYTDFSEAE